MSTLVELCAGTASLSLWAMGRCGPLTGYFGSKARWAGLLGTALDVDRPDRVVLADAGPWGDVWSVLASGGGMAVGEVLRELQQRTNTDGPIATWDACTVPPPADPAERVARYLWLQARTANNIAIWWDGAQWVGPTGSRFSDATRDATTTQRGGDRRVAKANSRQAITHGMRYPLTIARRIAALDRAIDWSRVTVHHGDCREVEPIPGATVYLDPPYLGCPRYAALLPRADVLHLVDRWRAVGCRVAVSEAVPLDLGGTCRRLDHPKKPEWVSATWPMRLPEQMGLFGGPRESVHLAEVA